MSGWIEWAKAWKWRWNFMILMLEINGSDDEWLEELRERFSKLDHNVRVLFQKLDSKGNPVGVTTWDGKTAS